MVYTMVLEAIAFGIESSSLSLRTNIIAASMMESVDMARLNGLSALKACRFNSY